MLGRLRVRDGGRALLGVLKRSKSKNEIPRTYSLKRTPTRDVVLMRSANPEFRTRQKTHILLVGKSLCDGSLVEIPVVRARAEACLLANPGLDLIVNLEGQGLDIEHEWGDLFGVSNHSLNRLFAKLLLIGNENQNRCHVIVDDRSLFPLIDRFGSRIASYKNSAEFLRAREMP